MTIVRLAKSEDAASILDIYKPYIVGTAYTFETEVPTEAEFSKRIEKYLEKYPWIVTEIDGRIAGYVYASVHREREAYQWTCECSVYIHNDFKGKGIGKKLYEALFSILQLQGFRNVYAGITIPNEASDKLHRRCGFEKFAEYENIGFKLGSWHRVGWWRLQLNPYDPSPQAPVWFHKISRPVIEEIFHQAAQKISAKF